MSPQGDKYYFAFIFAFSCTNNIVEYEGLIQGLEWARKRGIGCLQVHGDSELIINQVRGMHVTKNDVLKSYKHRVWDMIEEFDAFNLVSIPRDQNKNVDRLAAIGAQVDIPSEIRKEKLQPYVKRVIKPFIPDNNIHWKVFESDEQVLSFMLKEDEFAAINQEKIKQQYDDQIIQLKSNKLPKGLVTLESIFSTDNQPKKSKTSM